MATIKTPVDKLKEGETIEHYNAVLLEDIKGKMDQVIEKSDSLEKSLTDKIDNFKNELKKDIEITQHAVSEHTKMIKGLQIGMQSIEKRLINVENTVSDISTKIDKIGDKIDNHETRITNLETARL